MRRLVRFTEQIQLAGAFLHEPGAQYARLSLIICDNVAELLAHERCQHHLLRAQYNYLPSKLSNADRADARGQEFAPKFNLLVRLGEVTDKERDFATRAHILRSESYHTGILHEGIAWRAAWQYHELVCTLFERLRPSGYVMGGKLEYSERMSRLLKEAGLIGTPWMDWQGKLAKLIELLRATKPQPAESLSHVLSGSAKDRFTRLAEAIQFVADDGGHNGDRQAAIKAAYFHTVYDPDALAVGLDVQTDEGFSEFSKRLTETEAAYVPPLRYRQVERWMSRAKALAAEIEPSAAIVKYTDLLRESEEADTIFREAAHALDRWIQQEIDARRGK